MLHKKKRKKIMVLVLFFLVAAAAEPQCKNVPSAGQVFWSNFQTWIINPVINAPLAIRLKRTSAATKCPAAAAPDASDSLETFDAAVILFKIFSGGYDVWSLPPRVWCLLNVCADWEFGGLLTSSPFSDAECTEASQIARAATYKIPAILFWALIVFAAISFLVLMMCATL